MVTASVPSGLTLGDADSVLTSTVAARTIRGSADENRELVLMGHATLLASDREHETHGVSHGGG